ncbi:MAG: adenosylcobinamide-phosphate synthase CbiB [Lentisphaerales bacterium]|nr:adenosylcobinamide-phosphate synthase CbiB [Lentisphaerales bacterium]
MDHYLYQIYLPCCFALLLDTLIGDPRFYPHPVRCLGYLIQQFEKACRKIFAEKCLIVAGATAVLLVLATTLGLTLSLLYLGEWLDHIFMNSAFEKYGIKPFQLLFSTLLIYVTIAPRDLSDHAKRILNPLEKGDLPEARKHLSMIVGRDTENLDEAEISRATIESIAENTVDGVTAPLFYALLFGPLGATLYRAINTMDSMYAYKNERYILFGRVAARLDDVANFIPARLTGFLICLVAPICKGSALKAWSIMCRDGQKHPSPNSGISEAAVAGALGIQLGGPSTYNGVLSNKQTLGDSENTTGFAHINRSINIMYCTSVVFIIFPSALYIANYLNA